MAGEHLGLFDTPPDRRQIQLSFTIVGALLVALLIIFPLRSVQLGEIKTFVPVLDAFMLFSDLIIATLLYAQAAVFRSRGLTILASGYLFTALIMIPHALTFPGAFAAKGLLGAGVSTTAWLAIFRRLMFPLAVISYALLKAADSGKPTNLVRRRPRLIEGAIVAAIDSGRMSLAADARTAGAMRSPQLSAGEELLLHCLKSDTARSTASPFPETSLRR